MKPLLFIFILIFSVKLHSATPLVKFYLQDGSTKQYKISEIGKLTFINSNLSHKIQVYKKGTYEESDTRYLDSVLFTATHMFEFHRDNYFTTKLWEIDSIVFLWNTCQEIQIGNQTWMCKNLDVDHYRNGDSIPEVRDTAEWANLKTGAWCYYNNDPEMGKIYGKLYNWYAVDDPRGLAPKGWHVATDAELNTMIISLGGDKAAGGKLKETDSLHWQSPNFGATNESGFSALPSGYRSYDGSFKFQRINGFWWCSKEENLYNAWYWFLGSDYSNIYSRTELKSIGLSVRCIAGDSIPDLPKIVDISPKKAFVGDDIVLYGINFGYLQNSSKVSFTGADAIEYTDWSDTRIKVKVPAGASTGKVTVTVRGKKSNEVDFQVLIPCSARSTYSEVKIGTQVWMGENLDVCTYRNGDPIPEVTDMKEWANLTTGAWCYYNNDTSNGKIYGKLYNWYAVNDPRGLAPQGWHIPSKLEWSEFITYLGGRNFSGKLKSTGTIEDRTGLWKSPNSGATNETGFTALPGGYRTGFGTFSLLGISSFFWTSTDFSLGGRAWSIVLTVNSNWIDLWDESNDEGFSVRCIKGDSLPMFPNIDIISPRKAYIGDTVTILGTKFGSAKGNGKVTFTGADAQNYISWTSTRIKLLVPVGAKTGAVSVTVNGLKSNEINFTLAECTGRSSYSNVTIGTQVWMGENLDVCTYRNGDRIPECTDPVEWANLTTGAWCYYNNDPSTGEIYGKLYNCYAVNDPRGLAPAGWHIPTDEEWTTLTDYLGGSDVAGGKLKETGTSHWSSPNTGATNDYGFTALPGGYNPGDGSFIGYGTLGFWWTFSQDNQRAITRHLTNSNATIIRDDILHQRGCSVRCIKD